MVAVLMGLMVDCKKQALISKRITQIIPVAVSAVRRAMEAGNRAMKEGFPEKMGIIVLRSEKE